MDRVWLGMAGEWAEDNREPADHYTTKIGGLPDWPFPRESLAPDMIKCAKCGCQLCLVAQVYAPVSALKIEERLLLIFGCISPGCETRADSWRALRAQKLDDGGELVMNNGKAVPSSTMPSVSDSKASLLDEMDVEDDEDMDLEALGRAFLDAGTALASNSKKEGRKSRSAAVSNSVPLTPATRLVDKESPVAPCFYLYLRGLKSASPVVSLSSNYSSISIKEKQHADGDEDSDSETWAPETYEYDSALNADRTYLKFMKQLDANSEQCFRYSYGGKALLASQEVVDIGRCKLCGGSRFYEMQLMPSIIHFLQNASDDRLRQTLENWNWLTLLIYTCAKSCSDTKSAIDGWVVAEEGVILQSENTKVISQLSQFR